MRITSTWLIHPSGAVTQTHPAPRKVKVDNRPLCSERMCTKTATVKGLCRGHYGRQWWESQREAANG